MVAGFQETPIALRPRSRAGCLRAGARASRRGSSAPTTSPSWWSPRPTGARHEERTIRPPELAVAVRLRRSTVAYQLEIVAAGAVGPTVLANFPLYCGVAPPAALPGRRGDAAGTRRSGAAEQRIVALVNRDRARAGLGPVTVDARLTAVARAHCQDMVDHDFVGHVSPRTGTAADRVHRAGLAPEILFENVGRAYSAGLGRERLPRQPGPPRATSSIRARAGSASAWCSVPRRAGRAR